MRCLVTGDDGSTTVRLNAQAFAHAAIHCVQAQLAQAMPRNVQILIDCETAVRASTEGPVSAS